MNHMNTSSHHISVRLTFMTSPIYAQVMKVIYCFQFYRISFVYIYLSSLQYVGFAASPIHLILLYFIALITFSDECELRISPLLVLTDPCSVQTEGLH